MTTTTFGYDAVQDRIWMRMHQQDCTVWLTRRMVANLVGPILKAFERATPGEQGGASATTRVAIEHGLALHEAAPGQPQAQIRAGKETPGEDSDARERLCTRITTRTGSQTVVMAFETGVGSVELRMSRKGMHLWLRGLSMVLRQARWDLPEPLPDWLTAGVVPPAIQAILDKPLDAEPDEA